jgi:hypothetical protein
MRPLKRHLDWVNDAVSEAKEAGMDSVLDKIACLSHKDAQGVIYCLLQQYLDELDRIKDLHRELMKRDLEG